MGRPLVGLIMGSATAWMTEYGSAKQAGQLTGFASTAGFGSGALGTALIGTSGGNDAELLAAHRAVVAALRRFGGMFPYAVPVAWAARAELATALGQTRQAAKAWGEARRRSEAMGSRYVQLPQPAEGGTADSSTAG